MATRLTDTSIIEQLGGSEKIRERLRRFRASSMKMDAMQDELLEKYPDLWVAMFDCEVVGVADDLHDLLAEVKAAGIPTNETVGEFMDTNPMELIL